MSKIQKQKIVLRLPAAPVRRWHTDLLARLRGLGHDVALSVMDGRPEPIIDFAMRVNRLRGTQSLLLSDADFDEPFPSGLNGAFVVDLGGLPLPHGITGLTVLMAGGADASAVGCLVRGRLANVVILNERGGVAAQGLPSIERPADIGHACDQYFHRVQDLIVKALAGQEQAPAFDSGTPLYLSRSETLLQMAALQAGAVVRRVRRAISGDLHWETGWRRAGQDRVAAAGLWSPAPYAWLPDGGTRYYADPILFAHEGHVHLFIEDFPLATGKGVLAHCLLDGEGFSAPRVVLEEPFHLSYPQVFSRDGEIWMIPETAQADAVRLYRAVSFPDRWEHVTDLVAGAWSDPTLVEHEGRLWLFATDSAPPGSTWDSLHLFSAPSLMGPWTSHAANPVLVDARSARPAGPMFRRDGALWRPVQDCATGYGAALGLARVDRLDDMAYAQTLVSHLPPPAAWKAEGTHTLGDAAGIEVVDRLRRLKPWAR